MKQWKDLSAVPVPHRVSVLPKDERGYPIPATAWVTPDGKPDFRVIDPEKSNRLVSQHRCGICGELLGKYTAFVGGVKSIKHRLFNDIGMHKDCAEYALKVCPFLAAPKFAYSRAEIDGTTVNTAVDTKRPPLFGLWVTAQGYRTTIFFEGHVLDSEVIQAGEWHSVSWWAGGQEVSLADYEKLTQHAAVGL